jgi:hypothetical protein
MISTNNTISVNVQYPFSYKKQTSARIPHFNTRNLKSLGETATFIHTTTICNKQCCYLETFYEHSPAEVKTVTQTQADLPLEFTAAIFNSYLQAIWQQT